LDLRLTGRELPALVRLDLRCLVPRRRQISEKSGTAGTLPLRPTNTPPKRRTLGRRAVNLPAPLSSNTPRHIEDRPSATAAKTTIRTEPTTNGGAFSTAREYEKGLCSAHLHRPFRRVSRSSKGVRPGARKNQRDTGLVQPPPEGQPGHSLVGAARYQGIACAAPTHLSVPNFTDLAA